MRSQTILLVEAHVPTRRLLADALTQRGHHVLGAGNGREALELAAAHGPGLVLVDLTLPDVDGLALIPELRACCPPPEPAIIALSGYLTQAEEERVAAAGVDALLRKPVETRHMAALLEAYGPQEQGEEDQFGAGRRVVLADDDPLQLKLLRFCLSRHGFQAEVAEDGLRALAMARARRPDAIIADVMMPRMDGFELAVAVRLDEQLKDVPLLLVSSSYLEHSDRELAVRAGATSLITRTPDLRELVSALRMALGVAPPRALEPAQVPELERERSRRVIKQLERQVQLNNGLAQRCSALAAELAVVTKTSATVLRHRSLEVALGEAVAICFEACGVGQGALYLYDAEGRLQVRAVGEGEALPGLEDFFGQRDLLEAILREGSAAHLPSPLLDEASSARVLASAAASSALILPLVYLEQPLGAVLMLGRGRDLRDPGLEGLALAISHQITQVLAVTAAFAREQRAEQLARERATFLDALLEQAPDSILYLDPDGIVRYASRSMRNEDVDDLVGRSWFNLPVSDTAERRQPRLTRVLATGESMSWESNQRGVDGVERTLWSKMAPLRRDGAIVGAILMARDISEKKKADAHLIAADRMASVGILAAGVAHEINNPLASVIANLDLAVLGLNQFAKQAPIPPDLVEELRDARHAADRIRMIVRDLKLFSRAEEDRVGPVDVERVLDSTLRMGWNEIRHRARVVKDYGHVPPAQANESRLGQVFLNLLINAAHAVPEGNYDGNTIRVSTRTDDEGRIVVCVGDTGMGMTPEVQARIFSPFFTTKPVGVGTGLGLSICQRIVTNIGGTISFQSEVGRGTEFQVSLLPARFEAVEEAKPVTVTAARKRGRVLVIDDEVTITRTVTKLLREDHDVVTADSAVPALAMLREGQRFDVILCDLMMPQVTGMELFADLCNIDAEQAQRVVFLTGGAFTPRARDFLDSVSNHRLEKPFDSLGLKALINGMIR